MRLLEFDTDAWRVPITVLCGLLMAACGSGAPTAPNRQTAPAAANESPRVFDVAPTTGPIACRAFSDADRAAVLALVNDARAQARSCGSEAFVATGPLGWDSRLEDAARTQSADMASNNFFSHTGSDGSVIGDRVTRSGYRWSRVGENIAAGQTDAQKAVQGWLDSPGHCRNVMSPDYRDMAIACVQDEGSDYAHYWTQTFGTPLQ